MWLALNKASGSTLQDDLSVSQATVFHREFDDEVEPPTHQLNIYRPSPVHARLNPDGLYPPKMSFFSDVRQSDSPETIAQYLGPPVNISVFPSDGPTVTPSTMHPQYVDLGQTLRARQLLATWAEPEILRTATTTDIFGITAFARIEYPEVQADDIATRGPVPLA